MSVLTYDEVFASLRKLGVAEEKARSRARELCPITPEEQATTERDARVKEKAEQAAVIKLLREHGFTVRSTSQARASKVALGLPDLWCTHKTKPIAFWWETKRQVGGVLSEAQAEFAADCQRVGVGWHSGDRFHAAEVMRDLGLARPA